MYDVSTQDATTDEEIFLEAAARLKICEEAESENRIDALKALDFVDGNQWDTDIQRQRTVEARPALTINHTQTFCRRIENTLKQQRPRIKCQPTKDSTIDKAKRVNGLIRHIETKSNASVAYDLGGTSAIKIGWGYWRIVSEYTAYNSFEQDLKILPIRNTFTVYMDPSAVMPAGEDQQWCLVSEVMTRREYARKYPNAKNTEWNFDAPGDMQLNWESKENIRLAEYFRIHEVRDTLVLMQDGSTRLRSKLADPEVLDAVGNGIALDGKGKPITRPTSRCQVEWYRINGREVVEKKILPGKYVPIIRCEGNVLDVNGRVKRKGMVKDLMDPARMYNYWRTAQTEEIALAPKAPWKAYEGVIEGHDEWHDANQKSYSVLIGKAVTGPNGETLPLPERQPPAPVSEGFVQAAQGAERDLMAVAGMPTEDPALVARVVSGNKALQRKQGMADLTHWHYYDNQTLAIMWTGIILLDLIPYYYDTRRQQRIIGEDGIPQMVEINDGNDINDMTTGEYDVVMETGPGYATKREEAAENMVELLGTPLGEVIVKTGADVVLREMDFNGADILADRAMITNPEAMDEVVKNLPEQAQNIIGAMQAQLQEKDQLIQQQALEIKYKGDIESMKDQGQTRRTLIQATSKAHDTETKAASDKQNSLLDFEGWLAEIREWHNQAEVNRQTKLDVAEIQVAGSLLNTHAEAAHEKEAAKQAIKAGQTDRSTNGAH